MAKAKFRTNSGDDFTHFSNLGRMTTCGQTLAFRDIETTDSEELVDCPKCLKGLRRKAEILQKNNLL